MKMKGIWLKAAFCWFAIKFSKKQRKLLVDLQSNSNWKWKRIGLSWLRAVFGWFAIKFYLEMKGNWPELPHSRFCLICNQIIIENHRKLGCWQILVDLQSNSSWKCKRMLAQSRLWLICNKIVIEIERKFSIRNELQIKPFPSKDTIYV